MKISPIVLKPSQVSSFMKGVLSAGRVPHIHGSPGIGKSDIAHGVADFFDLLLIDFRLSQCDPTDLNGFPFMENGRSMYAPNKSFPLETDDLPIKTPATYKADGSIDKPAVRYKGWFLFFDELTSSPRAVQAAAYKILLDRAIGDHKLHPAVMMASAGNREDDNAIAEAMGTALQSRLVHAVMVHDKADWIQWAYKKGIDSRIIGFIEFKPELLYDFKPDHTDLTFACPRTWHMVSDLLQHFDPKTDPVLAKAAIAGAVSQPKAHEFMGFMDLLGTLPDINLILSNPTGTPVPTENGHCFALAGALSSHFNATNGPALYAYLSRMKIEYQVVAFRSAMVRDVTLMRVPEVLKWAQANAKYLQ